VCNDKINKHERHDSANFLGLPVRNLKICKEKSSVSDPYPRWLTSNTFFYLRKYILDYKMSCYAVSKLSHKSFLNLNEIFLAYIFKEKIMFLRICILSANRKSANFKKIYGPQIANPQIATFAEGQQI
jgi:hypothetical protein